jgi:hypothetical protein
MAECLAGLAGLIAAGDPSQTRRAIRLLAAADTQIDTSRSSWWPADQIEIERNLTLIRTVLDPETLAETWREGQAMSLAKAITDALS